MTDNLKSLKTTLEKLEVMKSDWTNVRICAYENVKNRVCSVCGKPEKHCEHGVEFLVETETIKFCRVCGKREDRKCGHDDLVDVDTMIRCCDEWLGMLNKAIDEARKSIYRLQNFSKGDVVTVRGSSWEGWVAEIISTDGLYAKVIATKGKQTWSGKVRLSKMTKK